MKTTLLILLSIFSLHNLMAQDFVRELDPKSEKVLLRGKITFDDLLKESTCNWLTNGAKAYEPKRNVVDDLSKMVGEYRFVVFIGTWCGDTKDLLPKFYRVLVETGADFRSVEMYGVNRAKQALNIEHTLYGIKDVPTIIVMHQYREVGRIVESVGSTIEEELDTMIAKDYASVQQERAKRFNK
jgi:thiol-disulfide isomerase/thioredoxin